MVDFMTKYNDEQEIKTHLITLAHFIDQCRVTIGIDYKIRYTTSCDNPEHEDNEVMSWLLFGLNEATDLKRAMKFVAKIRDEKLKRSLDIKDEDE